MEEGEKNALIQQRIKKMMENKKRMALREDIEHNKRLKSGTGDKMHDAET
jgi:hypothetical protein